MNLLRRENVSMSRVPYYPEIDAMYNETTFGIQEMTPKGIYDKPCPNHHIFRFDLLEALREHLGDSAMVYRDFLYNMISGAKGRNNSYIYSSVLYSHFPSCRPWLHELVEFGDLEKSVSDRVITSMVECINKYEKALRKKYDMLYVKILTTTHCYLYISPRIDFAPEERGVVQIC